jgi:hypothetical protein
MYHIAYRSPGLSVFLGQADFALDSGLLDNWLEPGVSLPETS